MWLPIPYIAATWGNLEAGTQEKMRTSCKVDSGVYIFMHRPPPIDADS